MTTNSFARTAAPDSDVFDAVAHFEPIPAPTAKGIISPTAPTARRWCRRGASYTNVDPAPLRERRKRIVICTDGTWNSPSTAGSRDPVPTNVWLMYQLIAAEGLDPSTGTSIPQLAYYHTGVGTGGHLDRFLGGVCGFGMSHNILDCYRFLVEHYTPGDRLYLFGFSRGAYTARSLAGLIRNAGIIDRHKHPDPKQRERLIRAAYKLYRNRAHATAPKSIRAVDFRATHAHPEVRITCIGVWDTVGSLGIPVGIAGRLSQYIFGFHDVTLGGHVDRAFHAIALDERRGPFAPTLWEQQPDAAAKGQILEQVWFTGAHSDIGGGYRWSERGLATLSLRWMVNRIQASTPLVFDLNALAEVPTHVCLHDSCSLMYRYLTPASRAVDIALGYTGARDADRVTCESIHPSVNEWARRYQSAPMASVNKCYTPHNVRDYESRMTEHQKWMTATAADIACDDDYDLIGWDVPSVPARRTAPAERSIGITPSREPEIETTL